MQPYLGTNATDGLAITAFYVFGMGWCCTITTRRNGETFKDGQRDQYELLTTQELVDVVGSVISAL